MASETTLNNLVINYLTQAQFDTAVSNGTIDANQIYLTPDSTVVPTISLNGSATTSPSFYAPTGAGTSGQYLKSNGSGAPSWTNFPTIINTRGTATSGGTTLSVVNTGDMYTWNNKQDKLTNPVTGTGTSGYLVKWNGTTTVTNGPAIGSGTEKFLREDGTWQTPSYTLNTDAKLQVAEVTSATQYYPIVGTGTTAATRQYDTTGFKYKGTTGTTSAVGSAILELGNSTASGAAGNKQAQIIMYGTNAKKATITLAAPSADIALALPTSGGTIALTSQLPSMPTTAANHVAGISIADHGTTSVGSASNWSAGSASTWVFEDVSCDDITAWSAGSYTRGTFSGGSGTFTATVSNNVLSFSHTHNAATHAADSFTAPSLSYTGKTASHVKSGGNGTAPSLTVTSTTVVNGKSHSITDNGHTHTLS